MRVEAVPWLGVVSRWLPWPYSWIRFYLQHAYLWYFGAGSASSEGRNLWSEVGSSRRKGSQCKKSRGSSKCHFCSHGQIHFASSSFQPILAPCFEHGCYFLKHLIVHVTDIGLWMFLDGSCINAMLLLVSYVTCLYVTEMANIINVPYTWVYRKSFFPNYLSGDDWRYPDFLCLTCPPFFDDAKRGKMAWPCLV